MTVNSRNTYISRKRTYIRLGVLSGSSIHNYNSYGNRMSTPLSESFHNPTKGPECTRRKRDVSQRLGRLFLTLFLSGKKTSKFDQRFYLRGSSYPDFEVRLTGPRRDHGDWWFVSLTTESLPHPGPVHTCENVRTVHLETSHDHPRSSENEWTQTNPTFVAFRR